MKQGKSSREPTSSLPHSYHDPLRAGRLSKPSDRPTHLKDPAREPPAILPESARQGGSRRSPISCQPTRSFVVNALTARQLRSSDHLKPPLSFSSRSVSVPATQPPLIQPGPSSIKLPSRSWKWGLRTWYADLGLRIAAHTLQIADRELELRSDSGTAYSHAHRDGLTAGPNPSERAGDILSAPRNEIQPAARKPPSWMAVCLRAVPSLLTTPSGATSSYAYTTSLWGCEGRFGWAELPETRDRGSNVATRNEARAKLGNKREQRNVPSQREPQRVNGKSGLKKPAGRSVRSESMRIGVAGEMKRLCSFVYLLPATLLFWPIEAAQGTVHGVPRDRRSAACSGKPVLESLF